MAQNLIEGYGLQRQVTLARPVLLLLALLDLVELEPAQAGRGALLFLSAYLFLAIALVVGEQFGPMASFRLPLAVDIAAAVAFLIIAPAVVAFWFLYLFVVLAAATHWGTRQAMLLAGVFAAGLVVRLGFLGPLDWRSAARWISLGVGTLAAGAGMVSLGGRERRHMAREELLERLSGMLQVEQGLAESIRRLLDELSRAFGCEQAFLVYRDEDMERLFVWKIRSGISDTVAPDALSLARADAYLADNLEASVCWNSLEGPGDGFGWEHRTGRRLGSMLHPPASTRQELSARSLMAATLETGGRPSGRILLLNGKEKFTARDLRWFEHLVRHLSPQLENVFLLRHLRARAVEAERSRISRDLHDGILQTLLSLHIQLGVLRHKLPEVPGKAESALAGLQKTVQHESEELRRMVTDLRPLRVQSADLIELMNGFAERYRNESDVALDLFVDGRDLRVPDRVCRELFQIYRESLNNIKKHAHASHVVVKLGQDETKVFLVVDDNGLGFSFSGRYTSEELDRLRLGPISIKERTRSVGGMLTVESNPGHGARLTVEIPLS